MKWINWDEDKNFLLKQDIKKSLEVDKKTSWTLEERVESPLVLNMVVVKLNNGGLAIYSPVKIHNDDAPHLIG